MPAAGAAGGADGVCLDADGEGARGRRAGVVEEGAGLGVFLGSIAGLGVGVESGWDIAS